MSEADEYTLPKSEQDSSDNYSAAQSRIWGGQGGATSAMPAGIVSVSLNEKVTVTFAKHFRRETERGKVTVTKRLQFTFFKPTARFIVEHVCYP